MAYQPIAASELVAGAPITQGLMDRLRDNNHVGKAPRGRVFTSNGTWTVPTDCEAIVAVVIGGGGNSNGSRLGGPGGTIRIWATVTPGQNLSVNVAAGAGGYSRITGIARARGGTNATATSAGTRGAVDNLQDGANYYFFNNLIYANADGDLYGSSGEGGVVIIEY